MPSFHFSNNLDLPPVPKPDVSPLEEYLSSLSAVPSKDATALDEDSVDVADRLPSSAVSEQAAPVVLASAIETEFVFELPIGYVDSSGQMHKQGVMRLARTVDEIEPMSDPRVQDNPAYATVIILSRVILSLGSLSSVGPFEIEGLFAGDLNYLQSFYRRINRLPE